MHRERERFRRCIFLDKNEIAIVNVCGFKKPESI